MISNILTFLTQASKSKTVIVNVLMVVASVLAVLQGHEVIVENPQVVAGIGAVMGVVNVVLRFLTTKPVSQK